MTENEAELKADLHASHQAEENDSLPNEPSPKDKVSARTPTTQDFNDPESEPAEMTALKLELSTLSTSYASLQSTLILLQTQLVDLKRVNREVQEENESYMILLREKTLSGQFDVMRQVGGTIASESEDDEDDERDSVDIRSLRSTGRSTLDKVDELPESLELELEHSLDSHDPPSSRSTGRHGRNRSTSIRGESLADLPITGPGLDLAAELGRAENKDILSGDNLDDRDRLGLPGRKRSKKGSDGRKVSASSEADMMNDLDALRTEVKSLKDANKALSLYASKIIDRIIAQEGFEHVLAADYEADPKTPPAAIPQPSKPTIVVTPKLRPQSVLVGRSLSNPMPSAGLTSPAPLPAQPISKAQRRSLSFDWKGFSFFSGNAEKKLDSNLRPLTLTPGTATVTGARKLDTFEDDEDRKERERLNATMKLMGIQPSTPAPVPVERSQSTSSGTSSTSNRRFSLFGMNTAVNSTASPFISVAEDGSRVGLGLGVSSDLTREALVQAEAQNTIAALDAHERNLSAELARGVGSGFTEIAPRSISRRSRHSEGGSGSGSTVWSAGMSANDE